MAEIDDLIWAIQQESDLLGVGGSPIDRAVKESLDRILKTYRLFRSAG